MPEERAEPGLERYSFIAQLTKRLGDEAESRMARLPPSAFKALIAYVEDKQLMLVNELKAERDPWRAAELRGSIDFCVDVAGDMLMRLMPKPEEKPAKEEDDG
jgi:transposase